MERLVDQAYAAFGEEARRRGIDYRCDARGEAGDRLGRRPRPPDHLEPALQRVPLDARRRPRRPRARRRPNGSVYVAVADTRPRDHADGAERIFRPFWSRDGGGTGLGLAIARELAVALGGRIEPRERCRAGQPLRARPARAAPLVKRARRNGRRAAGPSQAAESPLWLPPPSWSSCLGAARPPARCSWRCGRGSGRRTCSLFAGLVFAAKLGDPLRWLEACVCFVAYCAISSAAYLANDVRDRHDDRLHPVKRSRPIARGELSAACCADDSRCAGGARAAARRAARPRVRAARRGLRGAAGRVHVAVEARRAARRDRDRRALRRPRSRRRRGGRRADLGAGCCSARRCSRSSSRWPSAAASSCSSGPAGRPGGLCSTGTRWSSSTS